MLLTLMRLRESTTQKNKSLYYIMLCCVMLSYLMYLHFVFITLLILSNNSTLLILSNNSKHFSSHHETFRHQNVYLIMLDLYTQQMNSKSRYSPYNPASYPGDNQPPSSLRHETGNYLTEVLIGFRSSFKQMLHILLN
jgi:hypothetical protein